MEENVIFFVKPFVQPFSENTDKFIIYFPKDTDSVADTCSHSWVIPLNIIIIIELGGGAVMLSKDRAKAVAVK